MTHFELINYFLNILSWDYKIYTPTGFYLWFYLVLCSYVIFAQVHTSDFTAMALTVYTYLLLYFLFISVSKNNKIKKVDFDVTVFVAKIS